MRILDNFTIRCLRQNKVRTLVTIIGIILSVALFTAVAEGAYSGQQYLVRVAEQTVGQYHLFYQGVDQKELETLRADDQIEQLATLSNVGCAMPNEKSSYYPYLFITSMSEDLTELVSIHVVEGRLPETATELVIGDNLSASMGLNWAVGQSVTLKVGQRESGGLPLNASEPYLGEDETLVNTVEKHYTIVGVVERNFTIEDFSMPGCVAYTRGDEGETATVFLAMKDVGKSYAYMDTHFYGYKGGANTDLLMYLGTAQNRNLTTVLYGLVAILFVMIMFGSVALIYNSFSISVSERTKQFGLLKSIGATNKQIRRTVLDESLLLCVVAIPLGLVVGCAGIGLTLYLLRDSFNLIAYGGKSKVVTIGLVLNVPALLAAALVGLLTALISAWIPARRAVRITPIEAIRMSKDVAVRKREIRTSPLVGKLFGFAGTLASKNFKRNRKKYRTTVVSLFMSIVLFISASSFTGYLRKDIADNLADYPFDVRLRISAGEESPLPAYDEALALYGQPEAAQEVLEVYELHCTGSLPLDRVNPEYIGISQQMRKTARFMEYMSFYFLNDADYSALCRKAGLDPAKGEAMLYDHRNDRMYTEEKGLTYFAYDVFKQDIFPTRVQIEVAKLMDGYYFGGVDENESGDLVCVFVPATEADDSLDEDNSLRIPYEEGMQKTSVTIGARLKEKPMCIEPNTLGVFLPQSAMQTLPPRAPQEMDLCLYFASSNHTATADALEQLTEGKDDIFSVWDVRVGQEATKALLLVLNVFTYGFITLISLIAAANVFNTISTNISLRRREFATLKSVGMDAKDFGRMMRFECLLYGAKALVWGLPVSVVMCYLIYRVVASGFGVAFTLPWGSIAVAVGSVFVMVFATMLYAMHKLRLENTIETLRNENI